MKTDKPKPNKIKLLLSEQLGIEPEDIKDDDRLETDLHMQASDITDFLENLGQNGFDTSSITITEIETVSDILDELSFEKQL